MKSRMTNAVVKAAIKKHDGDYFAAADDIGEEPFRLKNAWTRYANANVSHENSRLDGAVQAFAALRKRLQSARHFQKENNELRRDLRHANDLKNLNAALEKAMKRKATTAQYKYKPAIPHGTSTWHEWLFSDLHYGKKCDGYDVAKARSRVFEYAEHVKRVQKQERPQYTRVAFLGDLIENASKHRDSRSGCEIDTAEQIVGATRACRRWLELIAPNAGNLQVVCVAGNHENLLGAGSQLNYMGKAHASYVIYHMLADHFPKIDFVIPDGSFACVGNAIYEHGDLATPTEQAMANVLVKRSRQVDMTCHKYRQGDKHVGVVADAGNLICNGAFFGDRNGTEFSGTRGYCAAPCQVGMSYGRQTTTHFVRFA